MAETIIRLALLNLQILALGACVTLALGLARSRVEGLLLSAGIGVAATIAVIGVVVTAGVHPSALTFASITAAAGILALARRRNNGSAKRPNRPKRAKRASLHHPGAAALSAVALAVSAWTTLRAASHPMRDYDAFSNWGYKAKVIFHARDAGQPPLDPRVFGNHWLHEAGLQLSYPPGLPGFESFVFHWLGNANTTLVHAQLVLAFCFVLASCIAGLSRITLPSLAVGGGLLVLLLPTVQHQVVTGYADPLLSVFWSAAAVATLVWVRTTSGAWLVTAALFALACLWLKREATVLVPALVLIWAVHTGRSSSRRRSFLAAVALLGAGYWAWPAYLIINGPFPAVDMARSPFAAMFELDGARLVAAEFGSVLSGGAVSHLPAIALVVMATSALFRRDRQAGIVLALVGLSLLGFTVAYLRGTGLEYLLASSAWRVLLPPIVLCVLLLPPFVHGLLGSSERVERGGPRERYKNRRRASRPLEPILCSARQQAPMP